MAEQRRTAEGSESEGSESVRNFYYVPTGRSWAAYVTTNQLEAFAKMVADRQVGMHNKFANVISHNATILEEMGSEIDRLGEMIGNLQQKIDQLAITIGKSQQAILARKNVVTSTAAPAGTSEAPTKRLREGNPAEATKRSGEDSPAEPPTKRLRGGNPAEVPAEAPAGPHCVFARAPEAGLPKHNNPDK